MKFKFRQTGNFYPKLVSVIISILLWIFVSALNDARRSVKLPLELYGLSSAFQIMENYPSQISVELRGNPQIINNTDIGRLGAYIDLSKAEQGTHEYKIRIRKKGVPLNIVFSRITPPELKLTLIQVTNIQEEKQ